MGGSGSGRQGWRGTVESLPRLDVRTLARGGYLRPGYMGRWTWTGGAATEVHCNVRGEVLLLGTWPNAPPLAARVEFAHTASAGPAAGGLRPWFRCPSCRRRCAILLLFANGWGCRCCARGGPLSYASSNASGDALKTAQERYERACRRMGDKRPLPELLHCQWPPPPKPKGMHWRTYERLWRRREAASDELDRAVCVTGARFAASVEAYLRNA